MIGLKLSQRLLHALSCLLGGYGVFCVIESGAGSGVALTAIVTLGLAAGIMLFTPD
jgi:hypothetical protein